MSTSLIYDPNDGQYCLVETVGHDVNFYNWFDADNLIIHYDGHMNNYTLDMYLSNSSWVVIHVFSSVPTIDELASYFNSHPELLI